MANGKGGFVGAAPEALVDLSTVVGGAAQDVQHALELICQKVLCDPPLPTNQGMALNSELAEHSAARMRQMALALAGMANFLVAKAAYQNQVSRSEPVSGPPPTYERQLPDENDLLYRTLGVMQVVGGGAEVVGGLMAMPVPDPSLLTKLGGAALVAHGVDDMIAGGKAVRDGQPQRTWTAENLGDGVDLAVGMLGPVALGAWASHGPKVINNGVKLAYGGQSAELGHIAVGVTKRGETKWFELLTRGQPNKSKNANAFVRAAASTEADALAEGRLIAIRTSESAAQQALNTAYKLNKDLSGSQWGICGPNCATSANAVLRAAGKGAGPLTDWAPILLYNSTKRPAALAGIVASGLDVGQARLEAELPSWERRGPQ